MPSMKCPGCGTSMDSVTDPDVVTDRCPKCAGTFFDKGELNVFATRYPGDIEYSSTSSTTKADSHGERKCARCEVGSMSKVSLLRFSDIIFDYCQSCEAFFLDSNEIEAMNQELETVAISGKRASEFRETIDGYLVRVDILSNVFSGVFGVGGVPGEVLQITVFFRDPIGAEFRLYQQNWTASLAAMLLLGQDIQIGDSSFDDAFMVQGNDEDRIKALLDSKVKAALLNLNSRDFRVFTRKGTIEILDNRIVYTEGPYKPDEVSYCAKTDKAGVVGALLESVKTVSAAISNL